MTITQPLTSSPASAATSSSSSAFNSSTSTSAVYDSSSIYQNAAAVASAGFDTLSSYQNRNQNALQRRAQQLRRWREIEEHEAKENASGLRPPRPNTTKVCFSATTLFLSACAQNDIEECDRLLGLRELRDAGGVNVTNCDGLTALHHACIDDNEPQVRWLLSRGANINCKDNEGWTPLHASASCGNSNIVRILISHPDCDIFALNCDNELACDVCENKDCEMLIRARMNELMDGEVSGSGSSLFSGGGDDDESASESETLKDFRQIELKTIERDIAAWIEANELTPLDIKAEFERTRDPLSGATILHVCAAKGYNEVLVKLLTAFESRIELDSFRDCDGYTALHAAAFWKQPETFETLLKFGANPELLTAKTSENIIASSVLELCKNDPKFVQMIEINKEKEKIAKESETQRKIFAKRQREIRRSTQGVKKEDLEKALKIMEISQNSTSSEQDFNSIMMQVNATSQAANEANTSLTTEAVTTTTTTSNASNAIAATATTGGTPAAEAERESSLGSSTAETATSDSGSTTSTWTIKLPPKLSLNRAEGQIEIEQQPSPAVTINNDAAAPPPRIGGNAEQQHLRKSNSTEQQQPSTPDTPPSVTMTISSTTPAEFAKRRRIKRRATGIEDSESGLILSPETMADSVNPFESTMSNSNSNSNSSGTSAAATAAAATESVDAAFDVILSAPSTQTRTSRLASSRPTTANNNTSSSAVSNASSTTSLNSGRHYDSDFDRGQSSSRASSIHSVDSVENDSLLKNSRGQYSNSNNNNNGSLETGYGNSSAINSSKNSRSGSTTSLASDSELRHAATTANSTTDSGEVDYKKLCKQLLRENEVLRRRIRELEEAEKRREQEVSREKRALQRTISEQEEELKSLGDVKADNVRLKDENGALIRVISKLSK